MPSPNDDEVVQTAAEAAEGLIFSRFRQSTVEDVDITVHFEDGILDVDIYLNIPEVEDTEVEQTADDAALAAQAAVDELFDEADDT